MGDSVRAAVAVGSWETEIRAFKRPKLNANDGLLRVEITGVCGTDVAYYDHFTAPRILGHHVVGFVEELGPDAKKQWGLEVGARVVMEEYLPCGHCQECRSGKFRSCAFTDSRQGGLRYGATPVDLPPALWGGFSEYLYLHPNAMLHRMPEAVPPKEATLALPLANGVEWMCRAGGVGPGGTVVIEGPGQQGLACALIARAAGATTVIVVGRASSARRLQLARKVGATHIINNQAEDVIQRVREITGGAMADLVLDVTSGGTQPVVDALALAHRNGTVLLGGYKYQPLSEFDQDVIVAKSLTVQGVRGHSYGSVETAIKLMGRGDLPLSTLVSHSFTLEETDLALKTAAGKGKEPALLVTVSPSR